MIKLPHQGNRSKSLFLRRELLTFIPAFGLAGLWYGWQGIALVFVSAVAVAWMARADLAPAPLEPEEDARDALTGLRLRAQGESIQQTVLDRATENGRITACMVLGVDDSQAIVRKEGAGTLNIILTTVAERLVSALREADIVIRLDGARFAVVLQPTPRTDLESLIQLSARLQSVLEQPISIYQHTIYATLHVGFCLSNRAPERRGVAMLAAAEIAATEAANNGPSAIRAFSTELQSAEQTRTALSREVATALENGQIIAWFQPQLCSDTGDISGFQAVARWLHPERGVLTEKEFLPAIETGGLRERLGEVMLYNTFSALRGWDRALLGIKTVSLPMPAELLANPKLAERVRWELDRFDIPQDRIRLILPQSAIPQLDHDVVMHNLAALKQMGLQLELSGFGSGTASVSTIRRSSADRIRIHRSFVTHVDTDPDQQRLVGAIISLAEGLGLATLADGVNTIGEHAMLTQLGCGQAQGTAIARPMAFEETIEWIERHRAKLKTTPRVTRRDKKS